MSAVEVRRFEPEDADGVLAAMMDSVEYAQAAAGHLPGHGDLQSLFYLLPEGADPASKRLLTVLERGEVAGVIDALVGFPAPATISSALFLIAPGRQRRGVGTAALTAVIDAAAGMGCELLRAACPRGWVAGERFLTRHGFVRAAPTAAATNRTIHPAEAGHPVDAWERRLDA